MVIAMANDHAGTEMKEEIKAYLISQGYEVKDFGTYDKESCDLSDFVCGIIRTVLRMLISGNAVHRVVLSGIYAVVSVFYVGIDPDQQVFFGAVVIGAGRSASAEDPGGCGDHHIKIYSYLQQGIPIYQRVYAPAGDRIYDTQAHCQLPLFCCTAVVPLCSACGRSYGGGNGEGN